MSRCRGVKLSARFKVRCMETLFRILGSLPGCFDAQGDKGVRYVRASMSNALARSGGGWRWAAKTPFLRAR